MSKRQRRAAAAMLSAEHGDSTATVCFDLGSFEGLMSEGETNALQDKC